MEATACVVWATPKLIIRKSKDNKRTEPRTGNQSVYFSFHYPLQFYYRNELIFFSPKFEFEAEHRKIVIRNGKTKTVSLTAAG